SPVRSHRRTRCLAEELPDLAEHRVGVAQPEQVVAQRPLARWSRGPVVLLGDAAHAMLPHQGQGANQTIEDAAVLAAELAGAGDVPAALHRYAARRRVRTRQ